MIEHAIDGCTCEGKKCIKCEKVLCIGLFYRIRKDTLRRRTDCNACLYAQQKARKSQGTTSPRPARRKVHKSDLKTRLLSHVEIQPDGCWTWKGKKDWKGYGMMKVGGVYVRAHRLAYELYKEPIPEGLCIDHLCMVKRCVNPDHLEAVSFSENTQRWLAGGLQQQRSLFQELYTTCKASLQVFASHPELPNDVRQALVDVVAKAEKFEKLRGR